MSTWAGERYGRGRKLQFGKRGRNAAIDATRLIDAAAVGKLEEHVSDAVSKGATLLHGGRCLTLGEGFYEPRVLAIVTPEMRTAHEVTFGPVVALFRFETDDEAIAKANDTEYGLAAYLYSQDATRKASGRARSGSTAD